MVSKLSTLASISREACFFKRNMGIYSNYKTKTCLSGRLRLPLSNKLKPPGVYKQGTPESFIDVSEASLRTQLIRNYLENDASLELTER